MKKTIIFLITIIMLLSSIKVDAQTTSFYEGEYIPNIWLNRKSPYDNLIYYSQARTFREISTNNLAYCVEPFNNFYANQNYESTLKPSNFTNEQIKNMTLISHFGYGYKNHTDMKWYAITQLLLWEVADPNGYYYFSSYKNGPAVNTFQNEINEIKTLVNNYKQSTSFNNQTFYTTENESLTIIDYNNVLNSFSTTTDFVTITNNTIKTKPLSVGNYTINLEKQSKVHNKPILFYQSPSSQKIMDIGDPEVINNKIHLNVIKTTTLITKKDDETNNNPQGDAHLTGAVFELYTENNTKLETITMDTLTKEIKNLPFGTYYIKEIKPGEGYKLNDKKHYFTVSKDSPTNEIEISNQVIRKTIKIKKEYGHDNNFKPEQNISFNILDSNDNLIKTIITNELGEAEITLPYGKYKIVQLTTTEGYEKIKPLYFEITSEESLSYNLKNYKIPVPNTSTKSLIDKILEFIKDLLCGKKQYK